VTASATGAGLVRAVSRGEEADWPGGRRSGGRGGSAENGGSVNNRAFMRPTLRSTHPTRRIPAFAGMEYR
jgi:hypothetical protein